MRIIAGEHRGRFLQAPPGQGTRPMLDRVREAMFSTLGPGVEGCYALDLFAGSGSLGLEALSRGAAFARFVEDNPHVVKIIRENVKTLGVESETDLLNGSAIAPSSWLPPEGEPARWADVIFFDPPYPWLRDERRSSVFEAANRLALEVLRPGGLLVFHTPKRGADAHEFDARLEADKRSYGSSALWYLRGPEDEDPESSTTEDWSADGHGAAESTPSDFDALDSETEA